MTGTNRSVRSILAFLGTFLWTVTVESSFQYLNLRRNPTFDDALPLTINVTLGIQPVSKLQCAKSCQQAEWCNSFFYNDVIKACLRHRIAYVLRSSNWNSAPGWRFYEIVSVCLAEKVHIADRLTATCYRIDVTDKFNDWPEALDACEGHNETLVVLEPVDRAQFLSDFLNANSDFYSMDTVYFIGAKRTGNPSDPFPPSGPDFVWLTGNAVNMTATKPFWVEGKPVFANDKNILALRVNKNFAWTEAFYNRDQLYICQGSFIDA